MSHQNSWELTDDERADVKNRLIGIVRDPEAHPRDVVSAARQLFAADRYGRDQTAEAEATTQKNRFLAIAERLRAERLAGPTETDTDDETDTD